MRNLLPVFFLLIFLCNETYAQEPAVDWQKVFSEIGNTTFFDIQKTPDNGFLLIGCSDGMAIWENARVTTEYTVIALLYKIDSVGNGNMVYYTWPGDICSFYNAVQTPAGKLIGAGYYRQQDFGPGNVMIDQVSSTGVREWWKQLGGSLDDNAYDIKLTNDGGLIFAGYTFSNDGNVTGNHGNGDMWIGKCDLLGNLLWQKCLGGTANDTAYNIIQLTDGSYVIGGTTRSNDGDVTNNAGNADAWLVKLDASGNLIWQKAFGGSGNEGFRKFQATADGGFIAVGYTDSNDGIVTNNHGSSGCYK